VATVGKTEAAPLARRYTVWVATDHPTNNRDLRRILLVNEACGVTDWPGVQDLTMPIRQQSARLKKDLK
jgi:hypothetical protein